MSDHYWISEAPGRHLARRSADRDHARAINLAIKPISDLAQYGAIDVWGVHRLSHSRTVPGIAKTTRSQNSWHCARPRRTSAQRALAFCGLQSGRIDLHGDLFHLKSGKAIDAILLSGIALRTIR